MNERRPTTCVFLISPARLDGPRAIRIVGRPAEQLAESEREIARALRSAEGIPLERLFGAISGLYFRGKLAYARRFARPTDGRPGVYLITADRGLVPEGTRVGPADVRSMAESRVDPRADRFRAPLVRSAGRLDLELPSDAEVVLLGSVATEKYLEPLMSALRDRLVVPGAIVGLGSLERGSLLLRSAREGRELACVPVASHAGQRGRTDPGDTGGTG